MPNRIDPSRPAPQGAAAPGAPGCKDRDGDPGREAVLPPPAGAAHGDAGPPKQQPPPPLPLITPPADHRSMKGRY